jgi:hypothetical protein
MNARIRVETEAKLAVQQAIKDGKIELAWSYILDYENSANPYLSAGKPLLNGANSASLIQRSNHQF